MKHFFTILILLVFIPFHTYGKRVYFEGFDMNDGLSHNTVNYITQDSRGFIWFGTKDGLNRYDGNSFKVYRHVSSKLNSKSSVKRPSRKISSASYCLSMVFQ